MGRPWSPPHAGASRIVTISSLHHNTTTAVISTWIVCLNCQYLNKYNILWTRAPGHCPSTALVGCHTHHLLPITGGQAERTIQLARLGTNRRANARTVLAPPSHATHADSGWGVAPPSHDGSSTDTHPRARATSATAVWQSFGMSGWTTARAWGMRFAHTAMCDEVGTMSRGGNG